MGLPRVAQLPAFALALCRLCEIVYGPRGRRQSVSWTERKTSKSVAASHPLPFHFALESLQSPLDDLAERDAMHDLPDLVPGVLGRDDLVESACARCMMRAFRGTDHGSGVPLGDRARNSLLAAPQADDAAMLGSYCLELRRAEGGSEAVVRRQAAEGPPRGWLSATVLLGASNALSQQIKNEGERAHCTGQILDHAEPQPLSALRPGAHP